MSDRSARSLRAIETRKKKAKRTLPRGPQSRNQGNTAGVRRSLKKQALLRAGKSAEASPAE